MVKCKKCKDGRDYVWDQTYNESTGKWRLWDSEREFPHKCDEKKKEVLNTLTELTINRIN